MNMTLKEAVDNHRKLWHGIADCLKNEETELWNTYELKKQAMKKFFPELGETPVKDKCFLCEFTIWRSPYRVRTCSMCPMMKDESGGCLDHMYVMFYYAVNNHDRKLSIEIAEQIAELPVINPFYKEESL